MVERGRDWVVVGRIEGAYGVKGWVRVRSFTDPPSNLCDYGPWCLSRERGECQCKPLEMRPHGKGYVARLDGVDDRDAAAALAGAEIRVPRDCLQPPAAGQYFWNDLLGLEVRNAAGDELGKVSSMLETGANDVMVIDGDDGRRRLVPFVTGRVVREVDLEAGVIFVDWDADF